MPAVQRRQADYDREHWQQHGRDEKLRHITLHLGKLLGKLSAYCEAREHGQAASTRVIETEVTPDLLVYARPDRQRVRPGP